MDPAGRRLTGRALERRVALAMIKRRAATAGLPPSTCCHTFRATGITAYLSNGGTLEHAQQIAGHASPKTTKLYDRTADTVTVDDARAGLRALAGGAAPDRHHHPCRRLLFGILSQRRGQRLNWGLFWTTKTDKSTETPDDITRSPVS